MQDIKVKIGDRIEMEHIKSKMGGKLNKTKYGSQLLDYNGIKDAKILMPILEGKVIPLEVGDEYALYFYSGSGLFQCNGVIKKRYLQKNIYLLDMEFTSSFKRLQRRNFYRLECTIDARFRLLTKTGKVLLEQIEKGNFKGELKVKAAQEELERLLGEWNEGVTSDLSGGGIRFHCKQEVKPEDEFQLELSLVIDTGIVTVYTKVKAIHCEYNQGKKFPNDIRGEFFGMDDEDREKIVKYVFDEQRKRIKRNSEE